MDEEGRKEYYLVSVHRHQNEGFIVDFEEIDLIHYADTKWKSDRSAIQVLSEDLNEVLNEIKKQNDYHPRELIFSTGKWSQLLRKMYYGE